MYRNIVVGLILGLTLAFVGCTAMEPSYLKPTEKEAESTYICEQQRSFVVREHNAIVGYVFAVSGYKNWSRCYYDV